MKESLALVLVAVIAAAAGFYAGCYYKGLEGSRVQSGPIVVSTTTSLYQIGVLSKFFKDFNNQTRL
ncbi:MAG: hypothetical protein ACP5KA_03100 [Desulfurococcaceae archaeon]